MKVITFLLLFILVIFIVGWIGLHIKSKPFSPYPERTLQLNTLPLPTGLPAPVQRFYRKVYGKCVPVIDTVVITGRAVIRPEMSIPLQRVSSSFTMPDRITGIISKQRFLVCPS